MGDLDAQVSSCGPLPLRVGQTGRDGAHQRVLGVDQIDVGPATFHVWHGHRHGRRRPVILVLYPPSRGAWVWKLAGEYLQGQHAERERVELLGEGGRVGEGFRGHVGRGRPAHRGETGGGWENAASDQL